MRLEKMKMDEPEQETYTMGINDLLDIFLDGMYSGMTSTLVNLVTGAEGVEAARAHAYRTMIRLVNDPAGTETIRDTIRDRIAHPNEEKRTLLRIKDFGND